jgi:hypothetical protein
MAAKKAKDRVRSPPTEAAPGGAEPEGSEAVELIATALASHDSAIRQLAEVVVNLHANIRAIREVVEALADGAGDPRVTGARARLRRVKLDE